MPLRDVSAFVEWAEGADPTTYRVVRQWLATVGVEPWQAPSIPLAELSSQPEYEVRTATVPGSGGVVVLYQHFYATNEVDVLSVR